jgi:hypothetical protein
MRALLALARQWEFSLAAGLALLSGFGAAYLFQAGDTGISFVCAFSCAGFLWDLQGFGRVGTVHLRLEEQREEGAQP